MNMGEHFRVFPLSNWTEMDIWQYIYQDNIEMPSLYYTHKRKVFIRDGAILAWAPFMKLKPTEEIVEKEIRCRTIGDIPYTRYPQLSCSGSLSPQSPRLV